MCNTSRFEEDSPLRADHPGHVFKEIAQPHENEPVIQKHVNSGFIGTDLEERLHKKDYSHTCHGWLDNRPLRLYHNTYGG